MRDAATAINTEVLDMPSDTPQPICPILPPGVLKKSPSDPKQNMSWPTNQQKHAKRGRKYTSILETRVEH